MSNFGKIKNIWNLDVVSREEMKTTLQEWDEALTSLQTEFNDVKRLTTLKSFASVNEYDGSGIGFDFPTPNRDEGCDFTRPIYIEFEHYINPNATKYNFVVILTAGDDYTYLTQYVSVKLQDINRNRIYFRFSNLPSNMRIRRFKIRWTPKKLLPRINETQEEGE